MLEGRVVRGRSGGRDTIGLAEFGPPNSHFHFKEVPHDLFKFTTGDENTGGPRFVGAAVAFRASLMRDEGVPFPALWRRRAPAAPLKTVFSRERGLPFISGYT